MGLFRFTQKIALLGIGFLTLNILGALGGVAAWHVFHPIAISAVPILIKKNRMMAAGADFSCLSVIRSRPICWGGSESIRSVPESLTSASALAAGDGFACALDSASRVRCWGEVPFALPTHEVRASTLDARANTLCVVNLAHQVECWGGLPTPRLPAPAFDVAVGESQACALDMMARMWCWGVTDAPSNGESTFVKLVGGRSQACGVDVHGRLLCRGARANAVLFEQQGVLDAALGAKHACVASGEWLVTCWGDNALTQTSVPDGLGRVEALVAGDNHTCVLKSDGNVRCWGDNSYGQTDVPESVVTASAE